MIFVNGTQVAKRIELRHLDRIIFGTSSVFIFKFPGHEDEGNSPALKQSDVDWEYCQTELMKYNQDLGKEEVENEDKLKEIENLRKDMEDRQSKDRKQMEDELRRERESYDTRLKNFEMKKTLEEQQKAVEIENLEAEREYNEKMIKYEAYAIQRELEFERERASLQAAEKEARYHKKMKTLLRKELAKWCNMIEEANLMAETLRRNFHFS